MIGLRALIRGRDSLALSVVSLSEGDGKGLLVTALAQQIAATGVPVLLSTRLAENRA
ncbi:exopolysaccharide biosynthesis protein [Brucella melitensis]|nr:exopolysaccharide biosynthesis protein [Brucella melitensis]